METRKINIKLKEGLHAKAAAYFVQTAAAFESTIKLSSHNKTADAKSIMGVMAAALSPGTEVVLSVDGKDERKALEALRKILESSKIKYDL